MSHLERNKKQIEDEAKKLNRPGYWACTNCSTHNKDKYLYCNVCSKRSWKHPIDSTKVEKHE